MRHSQMLLYNRFTNVESLLYALGFYHDRSLLIQLWTVSLIRRKFKPEKTVPSFSQTNFFTPVRFTPIQQYIIFLIIE